MSVAAPSEAAERFVEKWRDVELSERAASHEHFIDLCRLITCRPGRNPISPERNTVSAGR